MIELKVKRLHKDAVLPTRAHESDAGMDLTAVAKSYDQDGNVVYHTGLAFEIPEGYVGLLFPRSSNAKRQLLLSNSVGVIDCHFRGEVLMKFKHCDHYHTTYKGSGEEWQVGERVGQLIIMPYPQVSITECNELSETDRGTGGYGSSGK